LGEGGMENIICYFDQMAQRYYGSQASAVSHFRVNFQKHFHSKPQDLYSLSLRVKADAKVILYIHSRYDVFTSRPVHLSHNNLTPHMYRQYAGVDWAGCGHSKDSVDRLSLPKIRSPAAGACLGTLRQIDVVPDLPRTLIFVHVAFLGHSRSLSIPKLCPKR
jgi:hypothetical protein